ncbi:GAF domain-containing protein [Isoalcanivorax pacificus W11-5]|uniref:GAF domain-containing protein n=1 Tax=Isoalcanivorax pacificus W11-5 TaxID=391936 RepID=A0A0B4XM72_9GAMM|nr:GAF domain-containing protein [Isoalcanivorax pacificus W11-5]
MGEVVSTDVLTRYRAADAEAGIAAHFDAERQAAEAAVSDYDEHALRKALRGPLLTRRMPGRLEDAFRDHARARAANLLRVSIYGMLMVYTVVSGAAALFSHSPGLNTWLLVAVLPVGLVLASLWLGTRRRDLERFVEPLLIGGVFFSLLGCVQAALLLGEDFFAQVAAYETIYVLIIVFSILRLPLVAVSLSTLLAFVLAVAIALAVNGHFLWLDSLLYFFMPWTLCVVIGAMLENSERRDYLQNELLNLESQRLKELNQQAEDDLLRQKLQADYLALIAGNPSLAVLFERTLGFLVEQTGALIGMAYRVDGQRLRVMAAWGGQPGRCGQISDAADTLIGPVLQHRRPTQFRDLPANYLPIRTAFETVTPGCVLIVPVCRGDSVVAVIELGKLSHFTDQETDCVTGVATSFAFAVQAAAGQADAPFSMPAAGVPA